MKKVAPKDNKRVLDFLQDMQWLFCLQNHERTVCYKENADGDTALDVLIREDYQRIHINIYPLFWEESHKVQRELIIHEFCHYLTDPIAKLADALLDGQLQTREHRRIAVEKSTSMVDHIINGLLNDRHTHAKKAYQNYGKKGKSKK